ncbi:MAG: asparagine synthase C-terminal domain-containing protein [Mariniphaga sp.]
MGIRTTTYCQPEKIETNNSISFGEAVIQLRQLLVRATLARVQPGKTGVHVSGGLDSTGIACILADHIDDKTRLIGYSLTPEELIDPGNKKNEKEFIEEFSTGKGVPVRYLKLEKNAIVKDSTEPEFEIQHIEYPILRMAGKDGVTTLFSGWGGDEFLSLSNRGLLNLCFFNANVFLLIKYLKRYGILFSLKMATAELLPLLVPFWLLPTFRRTDWTQLRLLKGSFIWKHRKLIFFHNRKNVFGYGNRKGFIMKLLYLYHIPTRMDNWTMYAEKYGFEYKYPLLDKEVLDFWFSLPIRFTYENFDARLLFREIMKGTLTESIRNRRDKSETLKMLYGHKKMIEGKEYLTSLFNAVPDKDHLPFCNVKAYIKLFNSPYPKNMIGFWKKFDLRCAYLRKVELVKRYIAP